MPFKYSFEACGYVIAVQFKTIKNSLELTIQSLYSTLHDILCTVKPMGTYYPYASGSTGHTDVHRGFRTFLTHTATSYCCLMLKPLLWHASLNGKLPGYRQLGDGIYISSQVALICEQREVLVALNRGKRKKESFVNSTSFFYN